MDFARKQLEKYGWTNGKGLGKNENGISEALKPKLKRSVTGIGHDAAADFTEHWWSQLYDKAAKNVEVEEKNGKTKKIKTKDADEFEITNSMWRINRKRKTNDPQEQYEDFFIKKAVLTNGGSKIEKTGESESEEEKDVKKDVFKLTDEELFAACEGRTAHKGARHGLKATGKLARIAQQEQMLLSKPQYHGYSHAKNISKDVSVKDLQVVEDMNLSSDGDVTSLKKRKKKKKRCVSQVNELAELLPPLPEKIKNETSENVACTDIKHKSCSKSKNSKEDLVNENINVSSKKKQKKKIIEVNSKMDDIADEQNDNAKFKPRNKLKKNRTKQ